jgi:hypothetical protein
MTWGGTNAPSFYHLNKNWSWDEIIVILILSLEMTHFQSIESIFFPNKLYYCFHYIFVSCVNSLEDTRTEVDSHTDFLVTFLVDFPVTGDSRIFYS